MQDYIQFAEDSRAKDYFASTNGPNAFQDIAADLWSSPFQGFDRNAGSSSLDFLPQFDKLPQITDGPPGVLTSLEGVPKSEVTVEGVVAKLLPDDTRGLPHQKFIIRMPDGKNVLVAHGTQDAPRVPVAPGTPVTMKGEWIPQPRNVSGLSTIGVMHWTHRSEDENRHPSGWIEVNGRRYQ